MPFSPPSTSKYFKVANVRRKVSSLIEDIEKAKKKKNQLVGNSQFDPKRGNSNEVRNTLISI